MIHAIAEMGWGLAMATGAVIFGWGLSLYIKAIALDREIKNVLTGAHDNL